MFLWISISLIGSLTLVLVFHSIWAFLLVAYDDDE